MEADIGVRDVEVRQSVDTGACFKIKYTAIGLSTDPGLTRLEENGATTNGTDGAQVISLLDKSSVDNGHSTDPFYSGLVDVLVAQFADPFAGGQVRPFLRPFSCPS